MSQEVAPRMPFSDLHMDLSTFGRGVFGEDPLVRHDPKGKVPTIRSFNGELFQYVPNLDFPRMLDGRVRIASLNGCPYPYDPRENDLVAPTDLWKEFRLHAKVAEDVENAHPDKAAIVTTREGLDRALGSGRMAMIHSIEGLHLPSDPNEAMKTMEKLWDYGVRNFGFVWNLPTSVGMTGYHAKLGLEDTGITDLGKDVVKFLDEKGATIDVSHASDNTTRGILNMVTKSRVIASHAGSRDMTNHPRNLPKEIARELHLIGVPAVWTFIKGEDPERSIDRFAAHMEYFVNDVFQGDDTKSGFGFDLGGTMLGSRTPGLDDVATVMDNTYPALRRAGFSHSNVEALAYKNVENHQRLSLPSEIAA